MRRDAQRNREALLTAAREVFATSGLDAPLDEIARRAEVGNATLYRHFPDRAALVESVFHELLAETTRLGEEARADADAWAGLTGYLEGVFATLAANRAANDLMTTAIRGAASLDALHLHNRETIGILISRAQEQGTVRDDVVAEDLLFVLAALGRVVPASADVVPGAWRRCLALVLDGLRVEAVPSLPAPPLTPDQLGQVLHGLGPNSARRSK
ncbi:TetR/AcrR family transcriptional regulator [Streptomyces sp. WMMB 322]|uniref:TetR/AcrR family transcriptional regulator n=1 Tax=Streptomyces sp. WMMB 322 TaxID=1286821 RepID=UPI0006E27ACA|nr:TetR/AcrR family transcriptional regulator [Streptomyces sp. WMMB 322]